MSHPSNALTRLVDRLVPAQYHDADPDILRRARLCVLFAGLLAQQAVTFIAVYLALGLRSTALWVTVAGLFLLLTPWQLRHSLARGTHHLTGVLVAILIAVATGTGMRMVPAA